MTKQPVGATLAVSIWDSGVLVSNKEKWNNHVKAWLAVIRVIPCLGCLCVLGRGGGLVIGAINSLLLVSEATDIFITSVLRHRLFNLKKEVKFRMEIAHHHRNISAAETHYSLPVNLIIHHARFIFEGLDWGGGSGEERWWQGWQRSLQNHYYVGKAEGSIPKWCRHLGFLTSLADKKLIILNLRFSLLLPKPLMPYFEDFFGQVLW